MENNPNDITKITNHPDYISIGYDYKNNITYLYFSKKPKKNSFPKEINGSKIKIVVIGKIKPA